jgi:RNA polymerase sigma-70 factor (sigma-E family)
MSGEEVTMDASAASEGAPQRGTSEERTGPNHTGTVEREFTEFVVSRSQALLRAAFALTGDRHAAEDLVQHALAKAFLHWRRIEGDAEPYVRRILYHDSANRWRHRSVRHETVTDTPPDLTHVSDRTDDTHLRMLLRRALLELPPRQRAVLVLRYLEDRSVEETAEILGCRPGTVASQAHRALEKLRTLVPAEAMPSEVQ